MATLRNQYRHPSDLSRRHKPSGSDHVPSGRFRHEMDAGFVHAIPLEFPRDILFLDEDRVPYRS